jgi:hypothetical protein
MKNIFNLKQSLTPSKNRNLGHLKQKDFETQIII